MPTAPRTTRTRNTPTAGETRQAARDNIDQDAREFGLHIVQGGWRMGLLVARNVVKAPGRVAVETLAPKTNATEFARRSHTTAARVLRYLEAWDRAAEAGIVPPTSQLTPGQEVLKLNGNTFVLDADVLPSWRSFYNVPRTPPAPVVETRTAPETRPSVSAREMGAATQQRNAAQAVTPTVDTDPIVAAVVEQAGANYTADRTRGYPNGRDGFGDVSAGDQAANHEHAAYVGDVSDAIKAARSYIRRLGDLANAPELRPGSEARTNFAVQLNGMARQLERIAETMANPEIVVTDQALSELLTAEGA